MNTSPPLNFYHQVESFVIDAVAADISGDKALDNEIGMFLLMLLHCHKTKEENN